MNLKNIKNLSNTEKLTLGDYCTIAIIVLICVVLAMCTIFNKHKTVQEQEAQPIVQEDLSVTSSFKNTIDLHELNMFIEESTTKQDAAYLLEQSARVLGYTDIVEQALTDYQYYLDAKEFYTDRLNYVVETYYAKHAEKYPIATTIWVKLKAYGYNDYVCAGILGNVMAEVGEQTLNIKESTWSSNPDYYGICQWRIAYYKGVDGLGLEEQVDYLLGNIEKVFNTYGDYNTFINLTDEKAAALMFAEVYERCGSASYNIRQINATKALNVYQIQEEANDK